MRPLLLGSLLALLLTIGFWLAAPTIWSEELALTVAVPWIGQLWAGH